MTAVHTKLFKSNKSQAVRLPKPVALPDTITTVEIVAIGNVRIITPAGESWELIFGAERSSQTERNLADIEGLVARLEVIPFEDHAAKHFGELRAELYDIGKPIGRHEYP